jgi:hypothetical protein
MKIAAVETMSSHPQVRGFKTRPNYRISWLICHIFPQFHISFQHTFASNLLFINIWLYVDETNYVGLMYAVLEMSTKSDKHLKREVFRKVNFLSKNKVTFEIIKTLTGKPCWAESKSGSAVLSVDYLMNEIKFTNNFHNFLLIYLWYDECKIELNYWPYWQLECSELRP